MKFCFKSITIIFMLCSSQQGYSENGLALNCLTRGAKYSAIDNDTSKMNGGDTGLFYREVFKENTVRKISSCFNARSLTKKKLKHFFSKNYDGKEDQLPYHYFGVKIGLSEFEAGLYYDETSNKLKGFTSNFGGKRIAYLADHSFELSDNVCFALEYDRAAQLLNFSLRKNSLKVKDTKKSTSSDALFNDHIVAKETVKIKAHQIVQFKRVTSIALRSLPDTELKRARPNGGLTAKRIKTLSDAGLSWNVQWNSSYLIGYDGKIKSINSKSYSFASPHGKCIGTSLWPSSSVRTKFSGKDQMNVDFF